MTDSIPNVGADATFVDEVGTPGGAESTLVAGSHLAVVDRSRYDVRGKIAAGGEGRILEVYDRRLDRVVAIKELHQADHGPAVGRFVREALLTARLQHPSIVPVYDVGAWPTGEPFYAMKRVDGRPLSELLEGASSFAARLALLSHVVDCAQAIAFAHRQGIVHRDLKPANVLVGSFGETVVIDWGIAIAVDDEGGGAATNVAGTPAYMAPEQAAGGEVDARSDVYALGAILYHLLAGRSPYDGESSIEVMARVVLGPPAPLEQVAPEVPLDLAAIAGKAMSRDPAARYADASALADDLRNFQTGRLVGAHQYSLGQSIARVVRRHRAAFAVGLLAVIIMIGFGSWAVRRVVAERDAAEEAAEAARAASALAETRRLEAMLATAAAEAGFNARTLEQASMSARTDPDRALGLLRSLRPTFTLWGAAQVVAQNARAGGLPVWLKACGVGERCAPAKIRDVEMLDDARVIAVHPSGRVFLHEVATGRVVDELDMGGDVTTTRSLHARGAVAFTRADGSAAELVLDTGLVREVAGPGTAARLLRGLGGARLVTVDRNTNVRIWSGVDLVAEVSCVHPAAEPYPAVTLSGDGKRLVCASGADVVVVDLDGGEVIDRAAFSGAPGVVGADHEGNRIIVAERNGRLSTWARPGAGIVSSPKDPRATATAAVSPDGDTIVLADSRGVVRARRFEGGPWSVLHRHDGAAAMIGFDAASERVWSAGGDGLLLVTEVATAQRIAATKSTVPLLDIDVDSEVRRFAISGTDRRVRMWHDDQDLGRVLLREPTPLVSLTDAGDGALLVGTATGALLEVTPSGEVVSRREVGDTPLVRVVRTAGGVAALDHGGSAAVWGLDGRERFRRTSDDRRPHCVALSADGAALVLASGAGGVDLVDLGSATSRRVATFDGMVGGCLFAPDGAIIAWSYDGSIAEVAPDGTERWRAHAHHDELWSAAIAPDGRTIASVGRDNRLVEYSRSGTVRRTVALPLGAFEVAFWTPLEVVVRSRDLTPRKVDLTSGEITASYAGHGAGIEALRVVPGAPRMATGAGDGTVRIWDVVSGESRELFGHEGGVTAVLVRPQLRDVVTAGLDGTVRVWADDVPDDEAGLRAWLDEVGG